VKRSHAIILGSALALACVALFFLALRGERRRPPGRGELPVPPAKRALSFREEQTGVVVYAEPDRRHVAAVGDDGAVLWRRDLPAEAGVRPRRADVGPAVIHLGAPLDWQLRAVRGRWGAGPYVGVGFNDKSFGLLDVWAGAYTPMGND
jgi:hypothetical protein